MIIAFLPYIITRDVGLISFQKTGQIGDTIGGVTAPFIGVLSALLVYVSFRAQIKANELIVKHRHDDNVILTLNNWVDRLFSIVDTYQYGKLQGSVALITSLRDLKKALQNDMNLFESKSLNSFDSLHTRNSEIKYQYYSVIATLIETLNAILRHMKEKNMKYNIYEVNLLQIELIVNTYLSDVNSINKMIVRAAELGYPSGSPYGGLHLDQTRALIKELKQRNPLHTK